MSLKTFHILFIAVAALFAFGFAWWLINASPATSGGLAGGVLSALVGAGLIVYGIRFLKKLKNVSYL